MTAPMPETMSPREKVAAVLDPEIWADDMPVPTRAAVTDFHARRKASVIKADAILTALASGSGDHAELAGLAVVATDAASLGDGLQEAALTRFQAHANPATVLALLAENAALRAESESARTVVAWANNSLFGSCGYFHGDPYDGLHLARPIEALKDRATEAERKLAEAVGLLRDLVSWFDGSAYNGAWVIRSGDLGVDDAICAARTFLSKEAERG